ncbi:MAG: Transposase DDE domain protein [Chloroflexi bacterium ADurb.Bin360]|nr:MAG: Transposase DDE domain protein [Chloroflexi bacterium ADurb.Bin360]
MDKQTSPNSVVSSRLGTNAAALLDQIEGFVQESIEAMAPEFAEPPRGKAGRPRVLPSLCLWSGLVVCVLRGFNSQLALWRLLSTQGLWSYPRFAVSDQALYKRLGTANSSVLIQLFTRISALLYERLAPYAESTLAPFASEVMALDVSSLDQVARYLPSLREVAAGGSALLPGKLAALFDIRRQQWRQIRHIENPQENDKVSARTMLVGLPQKALLLADLGYFGFAWFDQLTASGYYWLSRLRNKTSYELVHCYFQDGQTLDAIVWLGKYRADRAAYAVRLVQFQVGRHTYRYLTNVLDPQLLPITDIAKLYARRWDIALAFKLIKQHLGLHLLWSSKPAVLLHQIWAVLLISQILQALRMEIAGRATVDPFDVSMQLLIRYLPTLAADGTDPIALFVQRGRFARFIRPASRLKATAPDIPFHLLSPPPPDLVLTRSPRYANKL